MKAISRSRIVCFRASDTKTDAAANLAGIFDDAVHR